MPNLGLNDNDTYLLSSNVDTVFHVAATVSLTIPIDVAFDTNVEATRKVLDVCSKMTKLRVTTLRRKYILSYWSTEGRTMRKKPLRTPNCKSFFS